MADFSTLVALTRAQNTTRIKWATFYALLLLILWWETRWPSLYWGISILLLGQLGIALALLYRNIKLVPPGISVGSWLQRQRSFETGLHYLENAVRALGFLLLAWGFWQATRNQTVALLLGVAYPLFFYFGVSRKNYLRTMARLRMDSPA